MKQITSIVHFWYTNKLTNIQPSGATTNPRKRHLNVFRLFFVINTLQTNGKHKLFFIFHLFFFQNGNSYLYSPFLNFCEKWVSSSQKSTTYCETFHIHPVYILQLLKSICAKKVLDIWSICFNLSYTITKKTPINWSFCQKRPFPSFTPIFCIIALPSWRQTSIKRLS